MHPTLVRFFEEEHIESYAVLSYADCKETSPSIRERSGFAPRSVILYLLPYYGGKTENLSCYAAARDYHLCIRGVGERLTATVKTLYPQANCRSFGDHSPIDERHAALIAGLGIAGDNGLLITEKYGSFVFIADLLTDIAPEELNASAPQPIRVCEHCGRCKAACPTGILRGEPMWKEENGDGHFDCLSAITQRKGELTDKEAELMRKHRTAWGCDLCQTACPHNNRPEITPVSFFTEDRIPRLSSELLAGMSDEEFASRAFSWRGKKTVERNLALLGE